MIKFHPVLPTVISGPGAAEHVPIPEVRSPLEGLPAVIPAGEDFVPGNLPHTPIPRGMGVSSDLPPLPPGYPAGPDVSGDLPPVPNRGER